jgi:putative ABC transport system permease protein
LLIALQPANLPRLSSIRIDIGVLAFTLVVSIVTGIVFGLAPSLSASKLDVNTALKEGGRGASGSGSRLRMRSALVISEIALAVVLLIGAGLLIRAFWSLRSTNPGFNPENMLTLRLELPEARYKEIPTQTQFRQSVIDGLNSVPGIQAAMISELPLSGDLLTHNFIIEGRPPLPVGQEPELPIRTVIGKYFDAMGIPIIAGRDFGPEDTPNSPVVGLVNQAFVREYFPDEDPIGKRIRWARENAPLWMTIIGVVGDVSHRSLSIGEDPAFYASYVQQNQKWKRWMYLVARSDDVSSVLSRVKGEVWAADKQIPLTRVQTMNEVMAASLAEQRFNMTMMGVFAAVALVLAVVGVYGVVSYAVAQRTHEIGIRMALGASSTKVLASVMGQGLVLTGAGVVIGMAGAFALTRVLGNLLFGLGTSDPLTFAVIAGLLIAVALAACFVPARRAARVDPMVALRYE